MADVITILHPEGAPEDNLYPNVKMENLPSSVQEFVQNAGTLVYSSFKETVMTPNQTIVLDSFTVAETGIYIIFAYVESITSYANEQNVGIQKNSHTRASQMGTGRYGGGQSASCIVEAITGDVITMNSYGYNPDGNTMRSRFMIARLR